MTQTIETGQGAVEDVEATFDAPPGTTTEQVQVAVGSYTQPYAVGDADTWLTPHSVTVAGTTVTASLRIGNGHTSPAAGVYWLWHRVATEDGAVLVHPAPTRRFAVTTTGGAAVGARGPFIESIEGVGAVDIDATDPVNPVITITVIDGGSA